MIFCICQLYASDLFYALKDNVKEIFRRMKFLGVFTNVVSDI